MRLHSRLSRMAQSSGNAVRASRAMSALSDLLAGEVVDEQARAALLAAAEMLEKLAEDLAGAAAGRKLPGKRHGPAVLKNIRSIADRLAGEGRPLTAPEDLDKIIGEMRRLASADADIQDRLLAERCLVVCREVAITAIDLFNAGQREGDTPSPFGPR